MDGNRLDAERRGASKHLPDQSTFQDNSYAAVALKSIDSPVGLHVYPVLTELQGGVTTSS